MKRVLTCVLGFVAGAHCVLLSQTAETMVMVLMEGIETRPDGVRLEWSGPEGAAGEYTVEYRDELGAGEWSSAPPLDQWPAQTLEYLDVRPLNRGARFYRVILHDSGGVIVERGRLISSSLERSMSRFEVGFLFALIPGVPADADLEAEHGVNFYKLVYETVDPFGEATIASGAVAVPAGASGALPMFSYQHGTLVRKDEAPSNFGTDESYVGVVMAGDGGYYSVLPDYLGLGESPGLHPFVIADSLASSTIDMLRAAREFADSLGVGLNGQLFLAGYSEGGYATMAAHRAIETQHTGEFAVTASTPMAGPYDMSGVMSDLFTSEVPVNSPYYLPYTILAYQEYYQIADDLSAVLTPELAALIPGLFDGTKDSGEINSMIPDRPVDFFQPEFLQDYLGDPEHPFRVILRENDVYRWNPQAPMRLYHCAGDELIPFETSQIAFDYFESEGKTDVELIDPDPDAGHGECAITSLLGAKAWFETLRE